MRRRLIAAGNIGSGSRKYRRGLGVFLLLSCAMMLNAEQLSMTTWYPSPVGVYQSLYTTGGTPSNPANTILNRDAGSVGIGTTNPQSKLHVLGDSGFYGNVSIRNQTVGYGPWVLKQEDASSYGLQSGSFVIVPTEGNHDFGIGSQSVPMAFVVKNTGNVGIGTVSPQAKLDVNGGIRPGAGAIGTSCTPEGTLAYDYNAHKPVYCSASGSWAASGGYGGPIWRCYCSVPGWINDGYILTDRDQTGNACDYANGATLTYTACTQLQ